MNSPLLKPEPHVLSTLESDGARRWLTPKIVPGHLFAYRRVFAYVLITVFTVLPFLRIGGNPVILLDIIGRKFVLMGYTFLPTDTVLLALFLIGTLLSVFLITAIVGRVWCGWACPQTVYMEFVFRPIERLFDGTLGRGGKPKSGKHSAARLLFRYAVYLVICFYLANTFLAYFVGTDALLSWVRQSPFSHPTPFVIVAMVTVAMLFDFCFFREQMCIIACPYGRFQSVLLDPHSLIVSYDRQRGEPRGKGHKSEKNAKLDQREAKAQIGEVSGSGKTCSGNCSGNCKNKKTGVAVRLENPLWQSIEDTAKADCIDCGMCVAVCPTGIDIRNGLQMECINCTQCIDACNHVMKKIGRAPDLIRYSSQANDQRKSKQLLRPRVVIYPLLLATVASIFFALLLNKSSFDVSVLREVGNPFTEMPGGEIRNLMKLKIANRHARPMSFAVAVLEPAGVSLHVAESDVEVPGNQYRTFHISVDAARDSFVGRSEKLRLKISNQEEQTQEVEFVMQGPYK